ncbi:MAG: ACP dehydratase [Desulfobulbaceae bacterium]|nr:ACP dehydratase [Desulfobulbaceae bacterium]
MSEKSIDNKLLLPCEVDHLVPQRPPMLIVRRLLERKDDMALVEAEAPAEGIWVSPERGLLPEFYVEVIAQAMAAVNGYDSLQDGVPPGDGFLVGVDKFCWQKTAVPGETLWIDVKKTFEFGAVKIIHGLVRNEHEEIASGEIKVWQGEIPEES